YAMRCDLVLRSDTVVGDLRMEVDLRHTGTGQEMYNTARQMVVRSGIAVTDLGGVGSAAFGYLDPGRGTVVIAYEDSLVITATWSVRASPARSDTDLVRRLGAVCRNTIAVLRG